MKPCRRRNSPLSQRSSLAPSTSGRCLGPDRPVETVGALHDGTAVGICVVLDRLNIIALLADRGVSPEAVVAAAIGGAPIVAHLL